MDNSYIILSCNWDHSRPKREYTRNSRPKRESGLKTHVQHHSSCLVKIYDTHDRRIVEYSVIQYNRIQYNRLYNSTIHSVAFILTSLKLNYSCISQQ